MPFVCAEKYLGLIFNGGNVSGMRLGTAMRYRAFWRQDGPFAISGPRAKQLLRTTTSDPSGYGTVGEQDSPGKRHLNFFPVAKLRESLDGAIVPIGGVEEREFHDHCFPVALAMADNARSYSI